MTQPEGLKDREQRAQRLIQEGFRALRERAEQAEAKLAEAERHADMLRRESAGLHSMLEGVQHKWEQAERERDEARDSLRLRTVERDETIKVLVERMRQRDTALADAARKAEALAKFREMPMEAWLRNQLDIAMAALASTDASDWLESKLGPLREREERLCEIGLRMVSDLEAWLTEIPEEDRTTRGCIKTQKLIDEAGDAFSEPSSGGDWLQQRLKAERERCAKAAEIERDDFDEGDDRWHASDAIVAAIRALEDK